MPFTVQLDLDSAANAALDGLAERLETLTGLATIRRLGDVHHLSLSVSDAIDRDGLDAGLARFAAENRPLDIHLGPVGIFTGETSVLYIAPVVSEDLLALHRRFHAAFTDLDGWAHYHPSHWVPHVTLAMEVTPDALAAAVALVRAHWVPMAARLDALRLIRFHPVETLFRQGLG
jgi:2'-5' RNA ligase